MIKLVASTFSIKGSIWFYLDEELISDGNVIKDVELEPGKSYLLHWVIKGKAGSTYSISVSSPKEALYSLTSVIGESEKELGGYMFQLK